ncbi:MAG: alpha/beta hydrolase [Planctomycetota bacterium]
MTRWMTLFAVLGCALSVRADEPFRQVEFPSLDGLTITADLYVANANERTPFLVLCHQAGWSRGEYRQIAPKLVAMGFSCLAIDQRSGGAVEGVTNETAARAQKVGKGVTYADARQDIVAALRHARKEYAKGALVAVGSSYSSALVLEIVGTEKSIADGVVSFAPGEYFADLGKSPTFVQAGAAKLSVPVFITSSKDEAGQWRAIFGAIPSKKKQSFVPTTAGNHGARALWERFSDSGDYWKALTGFLDQHFPRPKATKEKPKKEEPKPKKPKTEKEE